MTLRADRSVRAIQWGQHALFWLLLVAGAVNVTGTGAWTWPLALAVAALGGWYLLGMLIGFRQERTPGAARISWQGAAWLAVLIAAWLAVVDGSKAFVWLGFTVFLLCLLLLPTWAGLASVAVLTGWLIRLHFTPADPMTGMAGPLMAAVVAVAVAWGYRVIVAESNERARLITQLTRTRDDLVASQDDLAAAQREAGVLSERARLARDIHDTLAQGFSSIALLARATEPAAAEPARDALHQIAAIACGNLEESRRVVQALRPAELDGAPLRDAIGRLLDRLHEQSAMATEVAVDGEPVTLPTAIEVALLRVVQGALANVRSHSGAGRVRVTLTYEPDEVRVDVVDDGRGFDPAVIPPRPDGSGFGFSSMRQRLAEVGGQLSVESAPGDGTALVATVPTGRS